MLFLKYLDDLETEREIGAKFEGRAYDPIFAPHSAGRHGPRRWRMTPDLNNAGKGVNLVGVEDAVDCRL